MQRFTTYKNCPCSKKFLYDRANFRWCLTFDAVYIIERIACAKNYILNTSGGVSSETTELSFRLEIYIRL